MNQTESEREQLDERRHWLSKSRNSACFGRGVRWFLTSTGPIDWSVAMSLPLGLMAVLLLVLLPIGMGQESGLTGEISSFEGPASPRLRWPFQLVLVWGAGLGVQAVIAYLWLTQSRPVADGSTPSHDIVTMTIGGVWTAVSPVESPSAPLTRPGQETHPTDELDWKDSPLTRNLNSVSATSRVFVLWGMILVVLGLSASACWTIEFSISGSVDRSTMQLDRPWIAASWMLFLQAVWQLLPIPQSLGRIGWSILSGWSVSSSLSSLSSTSDARASDTLASEAVSGDPSKLDETEFRLEAIRSTRRIRWWMIAAAFMTVVVGVAAIQVTGLTYESGGRPLPLLAGVVLLSLWLFSSARNEDLVATQLTLAENGELGRFNVPHVWESHQNRREQIAKHKQLLEVANRERTEATDAARVDEILQRMHDDGPDSLSTEERELLKRVSEAIRRERDREN